MIARQIRYDDKIDGFTVKEFVHIADGNHAADPKVVLLRLERTTPDTGEKISTTMWFRGGVEVEVEQSPYYHSADDNVDSNLRDEDD